jgi:hypothetical protein
MSAQPIPGDLERLRAAALAGELPDARGRFGPFGGRYVPETLVPALERLTAGAERLLRDPEFRSELARELAEFAGRPTALTKAVALSRAWKAEIWLKREDLAHTGAHKINNALGQALIAKRLGARRVIAETGAGQHGVASAAACARLGLPCVVYMGEVDMARQAPNVGRMQLLGAEVVPVTGGDRTLRAAIDAAIRDWVSDPVHGYYLLGSAVGPHPYPWLVRELQSSSAARRARRCLRRPARCRRPPLPASAADPTRSACSILSLPTPACAWSASRPADVATVPARMQRRSPVAGRAYCTAATRCCCRMRTARYWRRTRSPRASTTRPSDRSTRCCRRSVASSTASHAMRRHSKPRANARGSKASCRRSRARMRSRARANTRCTIVGHRILVGLSGRGDKDLATLALEDA